MFGYSEAKVFLVSQLTLDASLHEAERYREMGAKFDELDANLPRNGGPEFDKLLVAFGFWEGWLDASDHDWKYYDGIEKADWPILARRISQALMDDREIIEPLVLAHFGPTAR